MGTGIIRTALAGIAVLAAPAAMTQANDGLTGVLIMEENQPYELDRLVRYNFETGRVAMEAEGFDGNAVASGYTVFIARCGDYNAGGQLTVMDADGFQEEVGPCLAHSNVGGLQQSRISLDGQYVALYDGQIPVPKVVDGIGSGFTLMTDRGGVRVYDIDGNEVVTMLGVGTISWGPDNTLYTAGLGESDTGKPHGIYKFSRDFQTVERIDDGRLNGAIYSLQVHPSGEGAMFIYNNQMWSIDFNTGKPRRELRFDFPIGHLAWSPDGTKAAFIVSDPIDEAMRRSGNGYYIHVFDGGEVTDIAIPFIPGGPLTWVAE